MKNQPKLFACVIKQYGTGLYRACVSLGENTLVHLGTHQNEVSAYETMDRFLEAQRNGEVKSAEDVTAFINSIRPNENPVLAVNGEVKLAEDVAAFINSIRPNENPVLAVAA